MIRRPALRLAALHVAGGVLECSVDLVAGTLRTACTAIASASNAFSAAAAVVRGEIMRSMRHAGDALQRSCNCEICRASVAARTVASSTPTGAN